MADAGRTVPARIAVVGAGPVGSVLAAALSEAGFPVSICEINDVAREGIRERGFVLNGARSAEVGPDRLGRVVRTVEELADDAPEVIVLCVKATAIPLVASALAEFVPTESTVVSWQNGIDTEREIARSLPAAQVVRAVVNYGVSGGPATGSVTVSFEHPPHYVQELVPGEEGRARRVAELFSAAGVETRRADALESMVWRKAILNASLNALCGLTGLTMEAATRDSHAWDLAERILVESTAVARGNEIWIGSDFYRWATEYLKRAGAHRPSMLLDLDAGRRTEIDYINGKIVEYGRRAGVHTPYNDAMLALVKAKERFARSSADTGR
jgi:2-dehydropantoate 2-reductase